jgi:hypothetical protein
MKEFIGDHVILTAIAILMGLGLIGGGTLIGFVIVLLIVGLFLLACLQALVNLFVLMTGGGRRDW